MKNYTIFLFCNNLSSNHNDFVLNISRINSEMDIFEKLDSKMNYCRFMCYEFFRQKYEISRHFTTITSATDIDAITASLLPFMIST